MMTKHTPGPWVWSEDGRWLMSQVKPYENVVRAHSVYRVMPQDAALIAAAPDLLAACEVAIECADMSGAIRAMVLDAVKKARGET